MNAEVKGADLRRPAPLTLPALQLLIEYQRTGSSRALSGFVRANLRLAKKFASAYARSCDLCDEAEAAALRAIAKAAATYDPARSSFSHHAHWLFRAEMATERRRARRPPNSYSLDRCVDKDDDGAAFGELPFHDSELARAQARQDMLDAAIEAGIPEKGLAVLAEIADCESDKLAIYRRHGVDPRTAREWFRRLARVLAS